MSDKLFMDRVRERDLDNFLVEELHASHEFRSWLLGHLTGRFDVPEACEIRLQKSPTRLQDTRQTDVQIGWFDPAGVIRARVLIESKVTADFQPDQAEAYAAEVAAARSELGIRRAASVLVAPAGRLRTLLDSSAFDASVSIEAIADALEARRGEDVPHEVDARLGVRVQLLEALCGKRASAAWIARTVPEKRDFAEAYAALARERLPALRVRPSTDGPKAITRIFEGLTMPGLPVLALRHEFGSRVAWKWVNAQFSGVAHLAPAVRASGMLAGTPYSAEEAGKSLAIRVRTPGIDPRLPFASQRPAVLAGLDALAALVEWLEGNAPDLATVLGKGTSAPRAAATTARAAAALDREFAEALRDIYAQCAALGYHPTGMLQMIERLGGIGTARRLLELPPSEGFARLALLERIDLAVESLVLEPRWDGIFTDEERRTARRRLRQMPAWPL
jgi:hypothetical protein